MIHNRPAALCNFNVNLYDYHDNLIWSYVARDIDSVNSIKRVLRRGTWLRNFKLKVIKRTHRPKRPNLEELVETIDLRNSDDSRETPKCKAEAEK